MGVENRARAEQRGGVHIVPAGMHRAVGRGEEDAGFLGYRESIEIRPHQRGGAIPIAEDSDDTVSADAGDEFTIVVF